MALPCHAMVTCDRQEAAAALDRGEAVVLIIPHDADGAAPAPGRLAVIVGDPDDPAAWEAAREMERELFTDGPRTEG